VSKFKLLLPRASEISPSLDASQKKNDKKNSNFSYPQGHLPAAASRKSVKIQALVNESFRNKPQPSCKSKKKIKKEN
jgi:hypothetical protein